MNRGILHQSSPVQQLMAAGGPNWWNIKNNIMMRPSPTPPPNNLFPPNPPPPASSWHHDNQELPESWSQLLMGGLVAEEDKSSSSSGLSHIHEQAKKLEIWEDQVDHHVKQETSAPNMISYDHHHHHVYGNINNNAELIQAEAANPTWYHQMMPVSSPKSCVTSLSSRNMLNFTNSKSDGRHPPPDRSSECNNTATGGAAKKARSVESSSSTQPTFKARKEKIGDRITALHQIVSPFGKTDTASVLFEVIGYIKFLQNQIEALGLPYLGSGSGNNMRQQQQSVQGERNCLFPEDPGQLLNDNCTKRKVATEQESLEEVAKDLRSKGLCLVPISCTLPVGRETNGADYWAPPAL